MQVAKSSAYDENLAIVKKFAHTNGEGAYVEYHNSFELLTYCVF